MDKLEPPIVALDHRITMVEILRRWPQTGPALLSVGLPCMGCAMARFHTIADAAAEQALEESALRDLLVAAITA